MHQQPIIPYDWTPDEAYATVTFLERLAEAIWSDYGFAIARDCFPHHPLRGPNEPVQLKLPLPLPDDEITF